MNLEEKDDYDQYGQNFQSDKDSMEQDIDAPPFDNSFSGEDQNRNQQSDNLTDTLSNEEYLDTDDSLDDSNLQEEDGLEEDEFEEDELEEDEDLEDDDSIEQDENQQFRNDESSNNSKYRGL